MKNISQLLKTLQNFLENNFKNNFTGLVLFGSYAKGTQNPTSDIDILITFKKLPKSRIERIELVEDLLNDLEDKYQIEINPIICEEKNLNKSFLMLDIAEYAKILVDKNKKITQLFSQIKKDYDKGFVRKISRGEYYVLNIENV